jgi:uncharacterized protein YecA (UPF0149 family)
MELKRSAALMMATAAACTVTMGTMPDFARFTDNEPCVDHNPTPYVGRDVHRNQPCPCKSGKKYKHCCMRKAAKPSHIS